jgi:uncharacterized repeat protein (TIGR03843 family)
LAQRERAAYILSELLGWHVVPETSLVDGPHGIGSLQQWVDAEVTAVDVMAPGTVPSGWMSVFEGVGPDNKPVVLVHRDDHELLRIAVFDVVINNADRKGGHILTDSAERHYAIDHGVTFHTEPKLRTVLWGWAEQPIPEEFMRDLERVSEQLSESELIELLSQDEVSALKNRIEDLVARGEMPAPSGDWPAIPWPVF